MLALANIERLGNNHASTATIIATKPMPNPTPKAILWSSVSPPPKLFMLLFEIVVFQAELLGVDSVVGGWDTTVDGKGMVMLDEVAVAIVEAVGVVL